jgi:hypothetical protein
VAELAREEADRAEAEQDDAPTPPEAPLEGDLSEPEPEPEPEPGESAGAPAPLSEAQVEAIFKALEREAKTHAREVEKRAGVMFADLAPCPCCSVGGPAPGYIFPVLPEPQQTLRRQGVLMALGGEPEDEYNEAPDRHRCEACAGLGKVLTGSKVPEQVTGICKPCGGMGFTADPAALVSVFPAAPPPPILPQPFTGAGTNGALDPWGRPSGHQHYGIAPAQVGA